MCRARATLQVTLISRDYDTPYSGMIPGHVAGAYSREECHIDLAKLARFGRAVFVQGEVRHIDTRQKVTCALLCFVV